MTLVHPREMIKAVCLGNAASVIVGPNHPSGDPTPSPEDLTTTRRLADVLRLVGVGLVDSTIIGDTGRWTSLKELGLVV
jgi:DNA repair protein RadC